MFQRAAGALPRQLTGFVGRRAELAQVTAMLSEARLVSVLGPGGVGKTRIAVQVAPEGDEILAWDGERREELPPIELSGALEDPAGGLRGDGGTVAVSGGAGGTARSLEVFRTEGGEPLLMGAGVKS